MKVNFKAVLMGIELMDLPDQRTQQLFANNQHDCEVWGKTVLAKLTDKQKTTGYIRVLEMREVPLADIHPAKVPGEFAVARYGGEHQEPAPA